MVKERGEGEKRGGGGGREGGERRREADLLLVRKFESTAERVRSEVEREENLVRER